MPSTVTTTSTSENTSASTTNDLGTSTLRKSARCAGDASAYAQKPAVITASTHTATFVTNRRRSPGQQRRPCPWWRWRGALRRLSPPGWNGRPAAAGVGSPAGGPPQHSSRSAAHTHRSCTSASTPPLAASSSDPDSSVSSSWALQYGPRGGPVHRPLGHASPVAISSSPARASS